VSADGVEVHTDALREIGRIRDAELHVDGGEFLSSYSTSASASEERQSRHQ
jgi:hypothetical protein